MTNYSSNQLGWQIGKSPIINSIFRHLHIWIPMSQKLHRFLRLSTRVVASDWGESTRPTRMVSLVASRRFYGDFMGVWLNGLVFQGKSSPETMAFPMEYRGNSEETIVFPWNMGKSSPETMVFTIKYTGFRLNLSHDPILWLTWFHWRLAPLIFWYWDYSPANFCLPGLVN